MSKLDGCAQLSDQVFFFQSVGFLFLAGLDPHLMTARRGWRSAAAAAARDLKRARCHANEAAGSGRSTSGAQEQDQKRDRSRVPS